MCEPYGRKGDLNSLSTKTFAFAYPYIYISLTKYNVAVISSVNYYYVTYFRSETTLVGVVRPYFHIIIKIIITISIILTTSDIYIKFRISISHLYICTFVENMLYMV